MKLTFLGTGTSQGVPVIGCRCEVCLSEDARDKRLRTSAMVECGDVRIVIDAGPDFRCQMLSAGVRQIDAIVLTHFHKDHTGGLDDVRAFNFVDYPTIRPVNIYATPTTAEVIRKDYDYAFAENRYRGVPEMRLHEIDQNAPFYIEGVEILPIRGMHSRFEVTGYRIGRMAYLTDFKQIADEEVEKLQGVDTLVVNALRFRPHDSHFSVAEAVELIKRVKPRKAFLTHLSHEIGLHAASEMKLPQGVELAYDGLTIDIND
ncbi:MAG: MBL fold metallo-hydrolase [Rikenellaceae bacterium]|nr:MBL fold metallo-hydrolase [Rikenellaceae bacterium]